MKQINIIRFLMVNFLIISAQIYSAARYTLPPDYNPQAQTQTRPSTVINNEKLKEELRKLEVQNGPVNFELRNKMSVPIRVVVNNGDMNQEILLNEKSYLKKGPNSATLQLKIDTDKQTKLFLTFSKPNGDVEKQTYFLPAGKTLLVSFEGILRPQKGSNGKTQSGLIIPKSNVNQKELYQALEKNETTVKEDYYYDDDGYDDE